MNFSNICRFCAKKYENEELKNIFSENFDIDLIIKIETFATIKISEDDQLPNTICQECNHKLREANDFRSQILASIDKLEKSLNDTNINKDLVNNDEDLMSLCDIKTDDSSDDESKKSVNIQFEHLNRTKIELLDPAENRIEKQHRRKKKVPDPASKTIVCPACGKILKRNSFSDHYSNVHQDEANIECDVCGKMFKNKRQLWHHKRKHVDQTISCDQCGKTFKTKEGFRSHFKTIHLGIRNHICKICSRKFARIMALKRHMRSHTGEKPYDCSYCSRSFAGKWNLKQHVRLHTKEKPYKCQICLEAFTQNVMLKLHMRNIHS